MTAPPVREIYDMIIANFMIMSRQLKERSAEVTISVYKNVI